MHLKTLTIRGFKSFAQATTFELEPGVTAIVGPNGSGKSNVVDALAWVMGEQGVKTLRGGKMEDVIFAGTSTRGPLGRAEVSLTIDNADGALPIEYSEVTISRTLFRNGASEYAINGEQCRLLDVQELLSDSGLGREMHVIVGQGQLDAVLRATPEDRRGFIEEAAGILKHRRRKEKSLRKLEAMETNLTRLNDLAGEIRRQLKPLGRQAEMAREAQTIAATVRDAKARILADDVQQLRTELQEFSQLEQQRHSERIVSQEQLEQKQLRIAKLEHQLESDELHATRRSVLQLESAQSKLRGLTATTQQRLTFLASSGDTSELIGRVSEDAIAQAERDADALTADIEEFERQTSAASDATQAAQQSLDALDEHIAAQSELISAHELERTAKSGELASAQSRLQATVEELERLTQRRDDALVRRTDIAAQLEAFEASELADVQPAEQLEERFAAAEAASAEATALLDAANARLQQLRSEHAATEAKVSALSDALESRDASTALLEQNLSGIRGIVADHIRVTSGYETAIAAALGQFAEALFAADRGLGFSALDRATSANLGRVTIVVGDVPKFESSAIDIAGVTPAHRLVEAPQGVLSLLDSTYIAENLADARLALESLTGEQAAAVRIVTRAGEIITWAQLTGGSGDSTSRIELAAQRDQASVALNEVLATLRDAEAEVERLTSVVAKNRGAVALALSELRENDARIGRVSQQHNALRAQLAAAGDDVERLDAQLAEVTVQQSSASELVAQASSALEEVEARPKPMLDVSDREQLLQELETLRQAEMAQRLQLETARERQRSARASADELRRQLEAEKSAAIAAAKRLALQKLQLARAEQVAARLPQVMTSLEASLAKARVELKLAESSRADQSTELSSLRAEEAQLREAVRHITEDVHSVELRTYEKKLNLSTLLERAGSELGLVEDVLIAEYGPEQPIGEGDDAVAYSREEQQRRLAKAERALTELGRINPLALEEFEALEQRHKFLTEQLADLAKTKQDLLKIVGELDEKMEHIFLDAFADTKAAFAEVFPVLFPGGSGEIELTNPDDVLTTGIEMTVKPAGKKVERLSLLSGGERSLAAVAWLIAIFKARPSPFYIMDEVEAALDDANLGRLLSVFEQLRANSQLIVITHQKRTMEIADALYGVSMRQDGVSAVVGQRVSSEENTREKAQVS